MHRFDYEDVDLWPGVTNQCEWCVEAWVFSGFEWDWIIKAVSKEPVFYYIVLLMFKGFEGGKGKERCLIIGKASKIAEFHSY